MKKGTRKLTLSKETLARIDARHLPPANGAGLTGPSYCTACDSISCPSECIACLVD